MVECGSSIPVTLLQSLLAQSDISKVLEILSRFVEQQISGPVKANIMLYVPEKNILVEGSCPSIPARPGTDDKSLPITATGSTSSQTAYYRKPIRTEDIQADVNWQNYAATARKNGIRGVYGLPILSKHDELLGTLAVYYSEPLLQEPAEKELLITLTNLAAITIERYNSEKTSKAILSELRSSQERLNLALQSQRMGVWDWSVQSGKLIWDPTMFELFGMKAEEATGTFEDFASRVHPEDLHSTKEVLDKVFNDNWPFDHHFRIQKNGEIRYIAAIGYLIRDEKGQALRMTGLNWDITEKIMASRKLENQRAKSIANSKMAALGEMASGIAHEINNPLTIILNRSNQLKSKLQEGKLDPTVAVGELEKIEITVERIAKIIRGLRAFSRNSDNDPKFSCELNSIIEESLELCMERFKKHGVELRRKGFENILSLKCRPAQISQVCLNLLNNSFDAIVGSSNPWIEMTVSTFQNRIFLRITDSGIGIPAAIADKMMDPFFTTKEVGQGTGLGLPISKGIVEDHEGKLVLDTDYPFTSFVIDLPLDTHETKINRASKAPSSISLEHSL